MKWGWDGDFWGGGGITCRIGKYCMIGLFVCVC